MVQNLSVELFGMEIEIPKLIDLSFEPLSMNTLTHLVTKFEPNATPFLQPHFFCFSRVFSRFHKIFKSAICTVIF